MRITITLPETDALTFNRLAAQPVFELVEKAVIARHFFLNGMKEAARSLEKSEVIAKTQPSLDLGKRSARRKAKARKS